MKNSLKLLISGAQQFPKGCGKNIFLWGLVITKVHPGVFEKLGWRQKKFSHVFVFILYAYDVDNF